MFHVFILYNIKNGFIQITKCTLAIVFGISFLHCWNST